MRVNGCRISGQPRLGKGASGGMRARGVGRLLAVAVVVVIVVVVVDAAV